MRNLLLILLLLPLISFGQKKISSYPHSTIINGHAYLLGYNDSANADYLYPYPVIVDSTVVSSLNIYNTNGTLTTNRNVAGGKFGLSFTNLNNLIVTDTSGNTLFDINKDNTPTSGMLFVNSNLNYSALGTSYGNYCFSHYAGAAKTGGYVNGSGNSIAFNSVSGIDNATIALNNIVLTKWDSALNNTAVNHLGGLTLAPTSAGGSGGGASPTITVRGDDLGGNITVLTGTSPATTAIVTTISFNVPYSIAPTCIILTPANALTEALTGASQVYVLQSSIGASTFTITSGSSALAGSSTYQWYYFIKQ